MTSGEPFGQQVKARRRELGLTQEELAHRVGCAPITLRKVEHDDLRPSVQIAERLAMALVIPLEDRAAFVRLARAERAPEPFTPTPMPKPEEIGLSDLAGRAIRGYALGERLGEGGMGVVYRATQPLVEREVAVKIILPRYADRPDFIRRFEAEAQLIARLEHPHIVPLYDYWREPGVAYLVMRLLRGGSVRTLLENGALALDLVDRLIEQICQALAAAHRVGVVHRDLKPANILLDDDSNAYLADFGIAKNLGNIDELTQADAIVGSPNYISPEQIRSEFVRPQTDIYCLGVMLYELLTGVLPFQGPTPIDVMHHHLTAPLPPLAARRAGLPATLDRVIAQATAKDPLQRYPDVDDMLADWQKALSGTSAVTVSAPAKALTDADNPYKGLRAFGEGDAADFFGRDALTQQLLARLGEGGDLSRFLAVVGPSGCGKSSAVNAGLIPALRRGGLPGSDKWFIVQLVPGAHPLEELEAALLRIAVNPPASLIHQLREDKRGLLRAISRCLPDDPEVELLLVIDQLEELFTLVPDEAARIHVLDSLVTAVLDERSRLRLVITLRADFMDHPLGYVDFGEMLRQRMEVVLPFTPDELERAITCPTERVGLEWEPGLVAAIMHDVGDQPGALPLLQYALTGLFEKREGRRLTKAAYQSIGGVLGALGRRAEATFVGLDSQSQAATRQLFLRLVTLGEGAEDTRRRVLRTELEALAPAALLAPSPYPLTPVLNDFGKARLLSFDRDPVTRGPTVEVAHEALLREWPRLREWLSASRADVRLQRQLAAAAAEWENAQRDSGYLLAGARLAQFEGWAATTDLALTETERVYLGASVAERQAKEQAEAERQRRELETVKKLAETEKRRADEQTQAMARVRLRNRLIAVAGIVALVLAVVAGGLALLANSQSQEANTQRALAQARELGAAAELQVSADPQLSLLLALQAISVTHSAGLGTPWDVQQTLHNVMPAQRLLWRQEVPYYAVKVAYSADGKRLTVIGESDADRTYVIDAATRQTLQVFKGYGFVYSPDEKLLVTGADTFDGLRLVRLWDAVTGQQLVTLTGSSQPMWSFALYGDTLIAGSDHADVWDLSTWRAGGAPIGVTLPPTTTLSLACFSQKDYVWGIKFSPDGKRLAAICDNDDTAKVYDMPSGKLLFSLDGHTAIVREVAFSPDGRRLATTSEDGTARIWDTATGKELLRLNPDRGALWNAAFSPDSQRLAVSNAGLVMIWDANTGARLLDLPNSKGVEGLVFSPDGRRLVITMNGMIQEWDVTPEGPGELATAPRSPLIDFHNSRDGSRFAMVTADGFLTAYESATLQPVWATKLFTEPHAEGEVIGDLYTHRYNLSFNTDSSRLLASNNQVLSVWDMSSQQPLQEGPSASFAAALSPDGRRLALVFPPSWTAIEVWDVTAQKRLKTMANVPGCIFSIEFSPDGRRLAAAGTAADANGYCSATGRADIWDLTGGTSLVSPSQELTFGAMLIRHINFSPDGKRLAAASMTDGAVVWDVVTGRPAFTLTTVSGAVSDINFSPDGKYLVTASANKTVQVWDAQTGAEVLSYPVPGSAEAYRAFFTPGNQAVVIASAGAGQAIRLNAFLDFDALVAEARARLLRDWQPGECLKYLHTQTCPAK